MAIILNIQGPRSYFESGGADKVTQSGGAKVRTRWSRGGGGGIVEEPQKGIKKFAHATLWKNRIFDHTGSSSHQWKAHLVINTLS